MQLHEAMQQIKQRVEEKQIKIDDELYAVFNDGLIIITHGEAGYEIKAVTQKPEVFDFNMCEAQECGK